LATVVTTGFQIGDRTAGLSDRPRYHTPSIGFVQADHFLDRLSYPIVVEGGGSLFFLLALIPFVSAPSSVS